MSPRMESLVRGRRGYGNIERHLGGDVRDQAAIGRHDNDDRQDQAHVQEFRLLWIQGDLVMAWGDMFKTHRAVEFGNGFKWRAAVAYQTYAHRGQADQPP